MTWRLTVAPETGEPLDVTVTVIVACPVCDAIVTALELTLTRSARVSDVTVIEADIVAPADRSFETCIVTWKYVAPCPLGAMTAGLTLHARAKDPVPASLPAVEQEKIAPHTGEPY